MISSANPVILLAQASPVKKAEKSPEKVTTYVTDDVDVKIKEKGGLVTIEGKAWGSDVKISIDPKKNEASVEVKGGRLFWRLVSKVSTIALDKWQEDNENVSSGERYYMLDILDSDNSLKMSGGLGNEHTGREDIRAEVNLQTKEASINTKIQDKSAEQYFFIKSVATEIIKEIAFDPKYTNNSAIDSVWDKLGTKAKYPG